MPQVAEMIGRAILDGESLASPSPGVVRSVAAGECANTQPAADQSALKGGCIG